MTSESVMDVVRHALTLGLWVVSPLLLAGLVVGLIIGVLQATTQIQESTLNFAPKMVAMGLAAVVAGPWAIERLVSFATTLIETIAEVSPGAGGL